MLVKFTTEFIAFLLFFIKKYKDGEKKSTSTHTNVKAIWILLECTKKTFEKVDFFVRKKKIKECCNVIRLQILEMIAYIAFMLASMYAFAAKKYDIFLCNDF